MQCTGKTTVAKGIIDKFQSPDGEIGNAVRPGNNADVIQLDVSVP